MYTIPSSILISRGCSMAHLFKNFRILQTCRTARQRLVRAVEVSFCVFRRLTLSGEDRGSLTGGRSEEHTSELQSQSNLVCRLLLEKKKNTHFTHTLPFTIQPPTRHHSVHPNRTPLTLTHRLCHTLYRVAPY